MFKILCIFIYISAIQTATREDPLYSRLHSGDSTFSAVHLSITTPVSEVANATYAQLNEVMYISCNRVCSCVATSAIPKHGNFIWYLVCLCYETVLVIM